MTELPPHLHQNLEADALLREKAAKDTSHHERRLHAIAGSLGRPRTLYALLIAVSAWIAFNAWAIARGDRPIDAPPFFWLQAGLALYGALVSTLVLVRQTAQSRDAERRAHVEFHVNLLAEQKATKIISLLEELRRDLPNVKDRTDSVAEAMQTAVDPELVDAALADAALADEPPAFRRK